MNPLTVVKLAIGDRVSGLAAAVAIVERADTLPSLDRRHLVKGHLVDGSLQLRPQKEKKATFAGPLLSFLFFVSLSISRE